MSRFTTFVGLDVHKKTISIAFAEGESDAARFLKREVHDFTRLLRTLEPLGRPEEVWRSPHVSRELQARSEGVTKEVRDLSWKTQRRLHRRLRALQMRGKSSKKALVAVARELACSIWALGQLDELLQPTR